MGSLSIRALAAAVSAAPQLGVSPEALLRAMEVSPAVLRDLDGRVPLPVALALFRELRRLTGDATVGLRLSAFVPSVATGVLQYLFRASPTLRAAYTRVVRYLPLANNGMAMELEARGAEACIRWRLRATDDAPEQHQLTEFFAGMLLRFGRDVTPRDWRPREVRFRHPPIEPLAERERILGAPVRFDCPDNVLVLPAEVLDFPLREQDPLLLEVMQRHADAQLGRVTPASVGERVQAVLIDLLPEGRASLDEVAAALGTSSRTLQRDLRREETSFAALLAAVRRDLARRLIAEGRLEITEVALVTGFAELSAFYRAFRRWTGMTPGDYRRQGRAG